MKARMFYFISDSYPAWAHDVIELFNRELSLRGFNVTWSMRRNEAGPYATVRQGEQTVYLPPSLGHRTVAAKIATRFLEAACEVYWFFCLVLGPRHDIIQVRDDRYLASFWAWLAARVTGAKFVYWLSFPFPENDAEKSRLTRGLRKMFLAGRARGAGWWLYHVLLRLADHVFVQSQQMCQDVASYGVAREKMTVVPMGVPQRLLDWVDKAPAAVVRGRIAYLGTMASVRRLNVVIEAFALVRQRCPDATLLMVGEGNHPHERAALEQLAAARGLAGAVTFTGFIPLEQAWSHATTAEICLSPIYPNRVLRAGSPTKLVEYMALGRPVVANEHPEQTEILRESGAGLCVPWGAAEFADAMIWMLEHPQKANAMGAKGPAWVAANRTYPIIAETVWRKYREILGGAA